MSPMVLPLPEPDDQSVPWLDTHGDATSERGEETEAKKAVSFGCYLTRRRLPWCGMSRRRRPGPLEDNLRETIDVA